MNRRNFFGMVSAAVAGRSLSLNSSDGVSGLRLSDDDGLYVKVFIADETRVNGGMRHAEYWEFGVDDNPVDLYKITDPNVDWYGAWL